MAPTVVVVTHVMCIDDGVSSLVEINRKAVGGKHLVGDLGGSRGRSSEASYAVVQYVFKTKRLCLMEVKVVRKSNLPPQKTLKEKRKLQKRRKGMAAGGWKLETNLASSTSSSASSASSLSLSSNSSWSLPVQGGRVQRGGGAGPNGRRKEARDDGRKEEWREE